MKILVVDDIPQNIQVIGFALKSEGYKLAFATSGEKAIEMAGETKYDLLLLDIKMPGIDGFETCIRIKKIDGYTDVPIVFLSALDDSENIVKGLTIGGVDYITKPFVKEEVLARVKNQLCLVSARRQLADANEKLSGANFRLSQQLEDLNTLYDQINKRNTDVQNSINYASRIIEALLPGEYRLKELLKDCFVFFQPKDTVGGDFYWMKQLGGSIYFAVADCTGHGVPGAFLSLLGTVYLNDLLVDVDAIDAGELLTQLGKRMAVSFDDFNADRKNFDLDIAVCKIALNEKKMFFSGVHMPLFLCRNGVVEEYRSNKFSLSHNIGKNIELQNIEIELQADDIIYLTSDGFLDQIGGAGRMKFLKKRFKELIQENCHYSMPDQKAKLIDAFEKWKKSERQIDDVCVLAFKVPREYSEVELF